MNPITPTRFIELLSAEDMFVKLWNKLEQNWDTFRSIKKHGEWQLVTLKDRTFSIKHIYESKPETPLDELDRIHDNLLDGISQSGKLEKFITKYESQLKEMK